MDHRLQDAVSLDLAQRVAEGLPLHPEWIELARTNIERWARHNWNAPALLRCYAEWKTLLDRPLPEIVAVLTAQTDEGQRMRQNSPFAGALPPRLVWEIKDRHRHGSTPP